MILDQDAWAVVVSHGLVRTIDTGTIASTRKLAIERFVGTSRRNWHWWYRKHGCRAIRVTISPKD